MNTIARNRTALVRFLIIVGVAAAAVGWLMHVMWCLMIASYVLMVGGALVFPVGIVHGWGLLLGLFGP